MTCPFCGGDAAIEQDSRNGFILKCRSCVIQYKQRVIHNSLEWLRSKMIENWNKRQPSLEDKLAGALERLCKVKDVYDLIDAQFEAEGVLKEYKNKKG